MRRMLLPFPGNEALAGGVAERLGAGVSPVDLHRFPDGESLVTLQGDVRGADVAFVLSLCEPDRWALPLWFAAATARELGARRVGLISPYLAYMRQDVRFHEGEAVSARLFARFLEQSVDWLVTVDPHLHRTPDLSALYTMPTHRVEAAPAIARWIAGHVADPILIGPDSESAQWVAAIAARAGAPFQVLEKARHGDRDVTVSLPDASAAAGRTPVIIDDIVSSGHTLLRTLEQLEHLGLPAPVVIAIHPVFAGDAFERLRSARLARLVSTDTIAHASNAITVVPELARAADDLFEMPVAPDESW